MKTSLLLSFLFVLINLNSYSQKGYMKGYIVVNKGDTLYGLVKDRKPSPFEKLYPKIRFKSKETRKRRFSPYDIKAYKRGQAEFVCMWFAEDITFFKFQTESTQDRGKMEFVRIAAKGYLSYYQLEYMGENNIESKGYFKREDESNMVFVRTGLLGLNKKRLISYFSDCYELQKKIANKSIKNPYDILRFYNDWYNTNK